MNQAFLDNSLWRNIYCVLAGDKVVPLVIMPRVRCPEVWSGSRLQ